MLQLGRDYVLVAANESTARAPRCCHQIYLRNFRCKVVFSKKPKEVNDMQSAGKESGKKRKSSGGAVNRGTVVK